MNMNVMSELEREEFETRMLAMSDDEKRLALRIWDSDLIVDEVRRRLNKDEKRISEARYALNE